MRAQASILTTLILTATAVAISLALWSLFTTISANQSEAALVAAAISRESSRVSIAKLSVVSVSINGTNYYRVLYQVSTLDMQPASIYIAILNKFTSEPIPINYSIYMLTTPYTNISNISTSLKVGYGSVVKTSSTNVYIKPPQINEYATLSLYYEGVINLTRIYVAGKPVAFIVEVKADELNNSWVTVFTQVNNKFYQIFMQPIP